ncbi:TonB-dependent receptor [Acidicapsa acidisoli]|uniref:TonB-dependent receptor n=1 Tax=Acidicapsa acidisoli TaxID=1615681 RepID=UPI0021DFED68|nr:carboxypeptidase regulatory-like domain-containing protein [Acidicapsa acidisoli]
MSCIAIGRSLLRNMRVMLGVFVVCASLWPAATANGQGLTGEISGKIQDSSAQMIGGADITLIRVDTGQTLKIKSDNAGEFLFLDVLPGNYSLKVEHAGFNIFEQNDLALSSGEHLVIHSVTLEVGAISETIVVGANEAPVETESSDRSGLIDTVQLQQLSLKGRDYLGLLHLLPGVLDTANPTREAPGNRALIGLFINGNRQGSLNLNLDGISTLSLGGGTGPFLEASTEAVAETKILLTNYQAEYGRSVGGTINTVTKNGTREFHGGAYYYFRNEDLNANDYFANREGLPRSRYRYNNPGYLIGGPVIFPGTKFNRGRDKLFFFWSQDILARTVPTSVSYQTFPTQLERTGDFSQSYGQNGQLIVVKDPLTGQPFPGNKIPAGRISAQGQELLNLFPTPGPFDPTHSYNDVFQAQLGEPHRDMILRVDWNISPKTFAYVRGIRDYQSTLGSFGFVLASPSWPQLPINYQIPCQGIVGTLIHLFSENKVNEVTFGANRGVQTEGPATSAGLLANQRSNLPVNIPQFFPASNPDDVVPNATFSGIPNAPELFIDPRFPYFGRNNVWVWMDNFSWTHGVHNMKFGAYIEYSAVNESNSTSFNGTFSFNTDANNPLDSGYTFANAVLGNTDSYTESTGHPGGHVRDRRVEWYAQDNWRATSRLTIDAGIRFYFLLPSYNAKVQYSAFDPKVYNSTDQPVLIEPAVNSTSGKEIGVDPETGQTYPAVKIGTFSPSDGGTPNQGMVVYNPGSAILNTPPIQVAPRLGFSWDVFGNGRTAVRSGVGLYYDRFPDDEIAQLAAQPPVVNTPTTYYTTIASLLASPLSLSPNTVFGMNHNWKPTEVANWSFGIQQDAGFGTLVDVAYIGNIMRRGMQIQDLNATQYGTDFLPSSYLNGILLPPNFLRKYTGFASIENMEFNSNSNYNALQVSVTKRVSGKVTFSVAYTRSKVLDIADTPTTAVNPNLNVRARDYGPAGFDARQNLSLSYVYPIPSVSRRARGFVHEALDGWSLSGVASFISGQPTAITYNFLTPVDITGANGVGVDSRVDLSCNPNLGHGDKSFSRAFNTSCIHPPIRAEDGIGDASKAPFVGPGIEDFDTSIFKNFGVGGSETRRIQFRLESYNTLNHPQFTTVSNNAVFDSSGNQVNNQLGQYTADNPTRRLVLALKYYF